MPSIPDETAVRRGRRLEFLTVGWNSLEAALSILAGVRPEALP